MDITLLLKKFHYIATPIGFITILIIAAVLCYALNLQRLAKLCNFSALFFFWLFSSPWFSQSLDAFAQSLYPKAPGFTAIHKGDADAIVVASWLKPMHPNNDLVLRYPNEKLYHSGLLSKKLDIPVIVISSEFPPHSPPTTGQVTYAQAYLEKLGVSSKNIIITHNARNTHEALENANNIVKQAQFKSIILVSTGARLARKYNTLKQLHAPETLNIIPFSGYSGTPDVRNIHFTLAQWLPNLGALGHTHSSFHDLAGMLAYKLVGWSG